MTRFKIVSAILMLFGIVYLGLHFYVTYAAYEDAGLAAAAATLFTLGFGDAYWTWAWWSRGDLVTQANAALIATIMAFASWGSRPWTRPALVRMALADIEAQRSTRREWDSIGVSRDDIDAANPGAREEDGPGGAF